MAGRARKKAVCNTCTLKLVQTAYRRAPIFRMVREPLKWGIKVMAGLYRIDPEEYEVRSPACFGCLRFQKLALKEKSALFRRLNALVNPLFDALLAKIVTEEEMRQATVHASQAMSGRENRPQQGTSSPMASQK
ncbi:MAG: hypothetical protein K4445_06840 [Deltaproteobacteria bacterium]|jgi:hypothetical protein